MRTRILRIVIISPFVVLFLICLFIFSRLPFVGGNPQAQRDLLELRSRLALGDSMLKVDGVLAGLESRYLECRKGVPPWDGKEERGTENWFVETPETIGANNFNLWLRFDEQRLTAIRVRTSNAGQHLPDEAPADIPASADTGKVNGHAP